MIFLILTLLGLPCHIDMSSLPGCFRRNVDTNLISYEYVYKIPRCSMYGICTYIYPKNGPNVGKYSIHGASGIDLNPMPFNQNITQFVWKELRRWLLQDFMVDFMVDFRMNKWPSIGASLFLNNTINVWKWAGKVSTTNKILAGVEPARTWKTHSARIAASNLLKTDERCTFHRCLFPGFFGRLFP